MIELQNVSKTFPGHRVLDSVSFRIEPGHIHALVGENGSGKSTLIKILAGYYTPDAGTSITVDGSPLLASSVHASHKLGLRFVHQHLALVDELSATDNIALEAGYEHGRTGLIDWKATAAKAKAVLAELDVELDVSVPVGELREVERSSIAIARALGRHSGQIRCIALDEPTAALPPGEIDTLKTLIRKVAATGVSVIYVSHRLAEILDLATDLTVLRDGKLIWTGECHDLTRDRLVELIVGPGGLDHRPRDGAAGEYAASSSRSSGFSVRGLRTRELNGVGFDFRAGEIVGVAGLDGSGREELALALGGAIPSTVELRLPSGEVVTQLNPRLAQRAGLALTLANRHNASAVRQFSIAEDITLPSIGSISAVGGVVNRESERSTTETWIQRLDVRPARGDALVGTLSGGNQQKAIIAKWLNTKPAAMIYSDPTSGVDVGAKRAIYGLMQEQAAAGVAVLVCSSDLEDLTSVCDRVIVLVAGHVSEQLEGADITESRLLSSITKGLSDSASVQAAA